jgi:16S rRNA U1498 N3-methylase RsmE
LVFVDDLDAPALDDADDHHLRRVLRLRDGDEVTIADGRGRWRRARFGRAIECVSAVDDEPMVAPEITVAFAVVKGDRPEFIVQKLTELGVDRVVPFVAARSVVRWDDDRAVRHPRDCAVSREARCVSPAQLPVVDDVARSRTSSLDRVRHSRISIMPPSLDRPMPPSSRGG